MYATVVTYELQSGKRDEAIATLGSPLWKEIVSLYRVIPGFQGQQTLVEPGSDKVLVLVLFETEDQAKTAPDSPQVQEIWAKLPNLVKAETVRRQVYEVVAQV